MLEKKDVLNGVQWALMERVEVAKKAAYQAYEQATNVESVAENKYDTFGLEASYLAHGQSQRVAECEADLAVFIKYKSQYARLHQIISEGSLVQVREQNSETFYFFISPVAGGTKVTFKGEVITLLSMTSPFGSSLLGKEEGDEIALDTAYSHKQYEVENCC